MGNCLKTPTGTADDNDISLLRGNDSQDGADTANLGPPPPYQERVPVYHPTPNVSRPVTHLTEEEQVKIAKRLGLIHHLPTGIYDGSKKARECVICMGEFVLGDALRFLPCMHTYHKECIDDWLMRSFTCPSCMEPVDAALLTSYQTN